MSVRLDKLRNSCSKLRRYSNSLQGEEAEEILANVGVSIELLQ